MTFEYQDGGVQRARQRRVLARIAASLLDIEPTGLGAMNLGGTGLDATAVGGTNLSVTAVGAAPERPEAVAGSLSGSSECGVIGSSVQQGSARHVDQRGGGPGHGGTGGASTGSAHADGGGLDAGRAVNGGGAGAASCRSGEACVADGRSGDCRGGGASGGDGRGGEPSIGGESVDWDEWESIMVRTCGRCSAVLVLGDLNHALPEQTISSSRALSEQASEPGRTIPGHAVGHSQALPGQPIGPNPHDSAASFAGEQMAEAELEAGARCEELSECLLARSGDSAGGGCLRTIHAALAHLGAVLKNPNQQLGGAAGSPSVFTHPWLPGNADVSLVLQELGMQGTALVTRLSGDEPTNIDGTVDHVILVTRSGAPDAGVEPVGLTGANHACRDPVSALGASRPCYETVGAWVHPDAAADVSDHLLTAVQLRLRV